MSTKHKNHKKCRCDKHSSKKIECFEHIMTMDLFDNSNHALQVPFNLKLSITKVGNLVSLMFPSFTIVVPASTPNDGGIIPGASLGTANGTNLPRCLWINMASWLGFPLSVEYSDPVKLYVANDGAFHVVLENGDPLQLATTYVVRGTTISYHLSCGCKKLCAPSNVRLTDGLSSVNNGVYGIYSDSATQLLEYWDDSVVGDFVAMTYGDNSTELSGTPPGETHNYLGWYVRTAKIVKDTCGRSVLNMNAPVYIDITQVPQTPSQYKVYSREGSVKINPTNPLNIVSLMIVRDRTDNNPRVALYRAVSFNGGSTFKVDMLADRTGGNPATGVGGIPIPAHESDPNGLFDDFGNYWIAYMSADTNGKTIIVFVVSTDGGVLFKEAARYATNQIPAPYTSCDYPRIAFGGDGQGGKALWCVLDIYNDAATLKATTAGYILVSGLGIYGGFTANILSESSFPQHLNATWGHEISVTESGKVYIIGRYYNFFNRCPTTSAYLRVNPTGTLNYTSNSFSIQRLVSDSNLGTGATIFLPIANYQNTRNRERTNGFGLAFDEASGRLYTSLQDMRPNFSQDMIIKVIYTENDGKTWSTPIPVADEELLNRGHSNITISIPARNANHNGQMVGNSTRDLLFKWYDSRRDATNQKFDAFAAVINSGSIL